jgi:hypothetical protein
MPKTVADIVYEPLKWDDILTIGLYVDYYDSDGTVKVGRVKELDLPDWNGLKYYIVPFKSKNYGNWYADSEIKGVHQFPKRKNG